jgi:hypothetical protein
MSQFSVLYWGSHPEAGNDDCHTGKDFATLEEAMACFTQDAFGSCVAYIELDGPGVYEVRKNPKYIATKDDDSEWKREIAMQAGMNFGCDGYNDAMGY